MSSFQNISLRVRHHRKIAIYPVFAPLQISKCVLTIYESGHPFGYIYPKFHPLPAFHNGPFSTQKDAKSIGAFLSCLNAKILCYNFGKKCQKNFAISYSNCPIVLYQQLFSARLVRLLPTDFLS